VARNAEPLSVRVRREVLDSGPCAYCGDLFPGEVDHVIPVSCGGTTDRDNLAPSCIRCNRDKTRLLLAEWSAARKEDGVRWPPIPLAAFVREVVFLLSPRATAVCARSQQLAEVAADVIWRLAGRTHDLLDRANPAVVAAAIEASVSTTRSTI
jgi:hypothetical protein